MYKVRKMNLFLIKKYIQKITKQDINTFAKNQGITLEEQETDIIDYYIKNKYKEFFSGNDLTILSEIKQQVKPTTYSKIEELYHTYKNKI